MSNSPTTFRRSAMKRDYDFYDVSTRQEYQRNYYKQKMSKAREKLGNKCAFCGWDDVVEVLEFAHKVGEKKEFCIGHLMKKPKGLLEAELEKCYLLCPTCHRVYDYGNRKLRK